MLPSCWGVLACTPSSVQTLHNLRVHGASSCKCISVESGEEHFHSELLAALSARRTPTDVERKLALRAAPDFAVVGRKRTLIDSDYFQLVLALLTHLPSAEKMVHGMPSLHGVPSQHAPRWLEFGVFEGRSANLTCDALAAAGYHHARVAGFDTFTGCARCSYLSHACGPCCVNRRNS